MLQINYSIKIFPTSKYKIVNRKLKEYFIYKSGISQRKSRCQLTGGTVWWGSWRYRWTASQSDCCLGLWKAKKENEISVSSSLFNLGNVTTSHVYFIYSLVRILRWFSLSGWIVLMSFTSKYSSVVSGGIPRGISVSWDLEHLTTDPAQLHWGGQ